MARQHIAHKQRRPPVGAVRVDDVAPRQHPHGHMATQLDDGTWQVHLRYRRPDGPTH